MLGVQGAIYTVPREYCVKNEDAGRFMTTFQQVYTISDARITFFGANDVRKHTEHTLSPKPQPVQIYVEGAGTLETRPAGNTGEFLGFEGPDGFYPNAMGVAYFPLENSENDKDPGDAYARYEMYDVDESSIFTLVVRGQLEVQFTVSPTGECALHFIQGGPGELLALSKRVEEEYAQVNQAKDRKAKTVNKQPSPIAIEEQDPPSDREVALAKLIAEQNADQASDGAEVVEQTTDLDRLTAG